MNLYPLVAVHGYALLISVTERLYSHHRADTDVK